MPPIPDPDVAMKYVTAAGSHHRRRRLVTLCNVVQGCRACPSMNQGQRRVLSDRNGPATANVMFIAEAPGRNGADRTGIPIYGDPTGNNFDLLLHHIGWTRSQVFITNCVLCNPRDEEGRNRTPDELELTNCSIHLESQIRIVRPKFIVTLGIRALDALSIIEPHDIVLSRKVGTVCSWFNISLIPLYHPSPRALMYRSMSRQKQDFINLSAVVSSMIPNGK